MTDIAHPSLTKKPGFRWSVLWDALRGRAQTAAPPEPSVSFAELVWAHHERQKEVYEEVHDGYWQREYERRLRIFAEEHGDILESYWCRYEASGVAITQRHRRGWLAKILRRDPILRIHAATDWRTANAPLVASWLHRWETAGIRASEILRETSERIALQSIFAATSRLLALVDRKSRRSLPAADLKAVEKEQARELAELRDYYLQAGENAARIVYFKGMLWGTAALAALVGGGFLLAWRLGWLAPADEATYTLFVSVAMGAAGAILSVMTRMTRRTGYSLEFEVGRKSIRYLGGLRPWIGATFALALYLALKSDLVELVPAAGDDVYFHATIAFAAGFSERRAKVLLRGTLGGSGDDADEDAKKQPAKRR